jgi:hypothetical protein
MHATILAMAAAAATAAAPQPAPMHVPDLRQAVIVFLNAYASGDKAATIAALDPKVEIYGSDLSAIYHGISGASDLFDANQKLWSGAAKFGTMFHVSGVRDGSLASVMLDIPFTSGQNPTVTMRFAMVWHLDAGGWKLVQSSDFAPGENVADKK